MTDKPTCKICGLRIELAQTRSGPVWDHLLTVAGRQASLDHEAAK